MAGSEQRCAVQAAFAGFSTVPAIELAWTVLPLILEMLWNQLALRLPSLRVTTWLCLDRSPCVLVWDLTDSRCTFLRLSDPLIPQLTVSNSSQLSSSSASRLGAPHSRPQTEQLPPHHPVMPCRLPRCPTPPPPLASQTLLPLLRSPFKCFLSWKWALSTRPAFNKP